MERLRAAGLHAKVSKCEFFKTEVEFLGHHVGREGVRMVDDKVEAIKRWPTPARQKEVEQFVGLAGYYRKFIKDFSKIAAPLTALCGQVTKTKGGGAQRTKPKRAFTWGDEEQAAFEALKQAVMAAPCLAMPDPEREFIVQTDASGRATGAVLMQQFDEGLRPIAFMSRRMKEAECNYPIYEQELLAIMNALRAWRHYLGGRRFSVITDHQALQYVEASVMATPRQVRWAAMMAEFDFTIKYAPGKGNVVADALSRAGARSAEGGELLITAIARLVNAAAVIEPMPVRVRDAAAGDAGYQAQLAMSADELRRAGLAAHDGLLYRVKADTDERLVVPDNKELRAWFLSWAHDAAEAAHRGGEKTAEFLKARVWWKGMREDAQRYAVGCEECQRAKPDLRGRQGLPMAIATPRAAGEVVCMDFIGPLTRTPTGENAVMVIIDKLTRYVMYIPLQTTASAQEVFRKMEERWIALLGAPKAIISDRDSRFTSHFWEGLWSAMGTELKRSTAFHPQTDGSTERANRTLVEALRASVNEQRDDWTAMLPAVARAHNASVCNSTGFTPDFLLLGREVRAGLDADLAADGADAGRRYPGAQQLHEARAAAEVKAREHIAKAQQKQQADSAKGRRAPQIKEGDRVWLSNRNLRTEGPDGARKLEPLWYGPYRVMKMHGPNAAEIQLPARCRLHPTFNLDLLRAYVDGRVEFPERPARHDRQGPIPEEDPAAGGPGEPVFEVDEVIGARGVGRRRQYRLLWKGWPREQASWVDAAECAGCADAVARYEADQARVLRASVLHRLGTQMRTAAEWRVAAAR
jgi:transposase InsO family protein